MFTNQSVVINTLVQKTIKSYANTRMASGL